MALCSMERNSGMSIMWVVLGVLGVLVSPATNTTPPLLTQCMQGLCMGLALQFTVYDRIANGA